MTGGKVFVLDKIYGISDSKFTKKSGEKFLFLNNLLMFNRKECSICLTNEIDTIVFPCKHMSICYDCACEL